MQDAFIIILGAFPSPNPESLHLLGRDPVTRNSARFMEIIGDIVGFQYEKALFWPFFLTFV
jgi:hypothetical protein